MGEGERLLISGLEGERPIPAFTGELAGDTSFSDILRSKKH